MRWSYWELMHKCVSQPAVASQCSAAPEAESGAPPAAARDDVAIRHAPADLEAQALDIPLVESRSPSRIEENGEVRIHALYRRVKGSAER